MPEQVKTLHLKKKQVKKWMPSSNSVKWIND